MVRLDASQMRPFSLLGLAYLAEVISVGSKRSKKQFDPRARYTKPRLTGGQVFWIYIAVILSPPFWVGLLHSLQAGAIFGAIMGAGVAWFLFLVNKAFADGGMSRHDGSAVLVGIGLAFLVMGVLGGGLSMFLKAVF